MKINNNILSEWSKELEVILEEYTNQVSLTSNDLLVIGCSTSEVIGEKIGTHSTMEVAEMLMDQLLILSNRTNVHLAFQCCEHLNRALVVSKKTANQFSLEEVLVKPSPKAGGAMATTAYDKLEHAVVVEKVKATAGIDIGSTFIGMHIKEVVIPVRVTQKTVGNALVTLATRRPKLIGGPRAEYNY